MSVTDLVKTPTGWKRARLGSISTRRQEVGFAELPLLSVFLGDGVVPRDHREDNHNRVGSDLAKYQRVLPSDIVFNKLRTWQGGFGVSRYEGIVSPAYIIASPDGAEVDARFLHHLLRSEPYLAELKRLSKWMPPSQFDIGWEDIRSLELVLPSLDEQRRIADFLDDQTTRIDRIVAARNDQIAKLDELRQALLEGCFEGRAEAPVRLALLARLQSGVTVDGQRRGDDLRPTPYLRVANVKAGWLDLTEVKEILATPEQAKRHALVSGDVLMTEGGDLDKLGRGTVWRDEVPGAIHQNHVFAVRVDRSRLLPEYLAYYLAASPARIYFETTGTRSTNLASTSATKVLDLPVPVASLPQQEKVIADLASLDAFVQRGKAAVDSSIDLLCEFRRSIISSAVSGEFDVAAASGRGVPA